MDLLFQIVKNFKKEELRVLSMNLKKYGSDGVTKADGLFEYIRNTDKSAENSYDDEALHLMFPEEPNENAYYRLKNRLKTELEKQLLNMNHDLDDKITVMNMVNLSNIYSYKSQFEISVHYLQKAEKLAEKYEFQDILELIYNELIALSHNSNDINPMVYIEKQRANQEKKRLAMEIDFAIASVRFRMRKTNFSKKSEDVEVKLRQIIQDLEINNELLKSPKVRLRIHLTVRDLLLASQDFKRLESYLINSLKDFDKENFFVKANSASKINLITWIINTLLINRKYSEAETFAKELLNELNRFNKLYHDKFIWTYYQSMITIYMSSGSLDEAIALLVQIKDLPAHKGVSFYDYAIYVNLSLCYYYQNALSAAIKTLAHLFSKELYNKLSPDFQLSIGILEMILHFENKNFDYVEHRGNELKVKYRPLLKMPEYTDEKNFIRILTAASTRQFKFRDEQVEPLVKKFLEDASAFQVGSNKHIDYKLWLQAKAERKEYYSMLVKTLGS